MARRSSTSLTKLRPERIAQRKLPKMQAHIDSIHRKVIVVVLIYCLTIQANNKSCGCGQNPLRTLQTASRTLGILNMKDAMNLVESDRETWGEFVGLLQAYDDCIRTSGGPRYRKRKSDDLRPTTSTSTDTVADDVTDGDIISTKLILLKMNDLGRLLDDGKDKNGRNGRPNRYTM
ncbi:Uncharacterised protein g9102 [Pycnogonum litorale]